MDLQDYFKIIKNNLLLIFVITAVVFASTLFFGLRKERFFLVSLPLFVNSQAEPAVPLKPEDAFYGVKAADGAAEALTAWLQSPTVQTSLSSGQIFYKNFKVIKFAPQFLEVKFAVRSEEDGKRLIEAIFAEANKAVNYLGRGTMFSVQAEKAAMTRDERNIGGIAALGLLTGLALGVFIAFLREQIKVNSKQ